MANENKKSTPGKPLRGTTKDGGTRRINESGSLVKKSDIQAKLPPRIPDKGSKKR